MTDVEEKVKVARHETEDLDKKLLQANDIAHMHAGNKLEQVDLYQEKFAKPEKEMEDEVKTQERVKILEVEARQLKNKLRDSQSKIIQLEHNATIAANKLDDLTMNVIVLREKEVALQEQLAAAEFRAKIAQEKFDMQTELLQKEMKMKAIKNDELNNTGVTFNPQDIDFIQLIEKLQDLENQFKSSSNRSEDHDKLNKLSKGDSVKEIQRNTNCKKLSEISETKTKKHENIITSLEEDLQGCPGSPTCLPKSSSKQTEDKVKQRETNVIMPEDKMYQSREKMFDLGQNSISAEYLIDAKDKLSAAELELNSAALREIELQSKLTDYEEQLRVQESIIDQTTTRCVELEALLESQIRETEKKCLEAKEAFMCAVTAAKRLDEKLSPLEVQGKQSENQSAQASASAAGSQMKGLARITQDIARSVFLPFRCRTERMLENENVFALDARTSWTKNSAQPSSLSFKFVLGVALLSLLIGFIIGNH